MNENVEDTNDNVDQPLSVYRSMMGNQVVKLAENEKYVTLINEQGETFKLPHEIFGLLYKRTSLNG